MARLILRYTCSWLIIAIVLFLSFFKVPQTPLEEVPFMDKWVHIVMYLVMSSSIWIEYLRSHTSVNNRKITLGAFILPLLMSGGVEILQEFCTATRHGDIMDFVANCVGVILGNILGHLVYKNLFLRKRKQA